jgi:hypothetical protein
MTSWTHAKQYSWLLFTLFDLEITIYSHLVINRHTEK